MKSTSEPSFDDRFDNNLPDYVNLTPVDYDPFARAAQRTRAHYEEANQRTSGLPQVLDYYGNKIKSALTAPQDAFSGQMQVSDPETGMLTQEAMGRAGEVAGLTGIGSPFAVKGALGSAGGRLMQMENKAPPFYSALEHAVENTKQQKMPADQWLGTISNSKGVKPEELDWTGFKDFLAEKGKEPVTKVEVQEHLNNNKVELKEVNKLDNVKKSKDDLIRENMNRGYTREEAEQTADRQLNEGYMNNMYPTNLTKYSQYQLPGGENYREMLMTTPVKTSPKAQEAYDLTKRMSDGEFNSLNDADRRALFAKRDQLLKDAKTEETQPYKSSHWDEPNILAHVRMNDRNIEGKRSLHLEEIQSDWHQQGREKGYKTHEQKQEFIDHYIKAGYSKEAAEKLANTEVNTSGALPDAPFKKSWHELVLKRMIREAAEKGYDRLSWTPGEAQAARYDLSKQISEVHYNKSRGVLTAYDKNHNPIIVKDAKPEQVSDYVGKETAKKLFEEGKQPQSTVRGAENNETYRLKDQDLKVGGEGMKGFYDQIIPKAIEKIGKEHGVKVKTAHVGIPHKNGVQGQDLNVHYIEIPQSLKDTAMSKGFPLFSSGLPFNFTPVDGNPFEKKK